MRVSAPHLSGALLFGVMACSNAIGAQTFTVSKDDYKLDTAVAVYFEEADGQQKPYMFSGDGKPMQMLMCRATLDSGIPKIIRAIRALPEYTGRKVVGVKCMRTNKKPIDLYP